MNCRTVIPSPVDDLTLTSDGEALTGLDFESCDSKVRPTEGLREAELPLLAEARRQLNLYFEGNLKCFDLPVRLIGSEFQIRVWEELRKIPFGKTISYAELAKRVGSANGFRAVGNANGRNPVAIIVPCHRVIGANGALTGFGGGMSRKRWLLDHEARTSDAELFA